MKFMQNDIFENLLLTMSNPAQQTDQGLQDQIYQQNV
jgi:hypothetical protein